jgi:hypothetical protein
MVFKYFDVGPEAENFNGSYFETLSSGQTSFFFRWLCLYP